MEEDDELKLYWSAFNYDLLIQMIKKPDLRIDTEFFDDNLNDLNIPEAIKVTQSIDTQNFIKEGLNDEPIDASTILAV